MTLDRARLVQAWNTFWFAPASPVNLAAVRIIFALHALWILGSRDLAATSELPAAFWAGVPAGERWRYLLLPEIAGADRTLQWMAATALVAAAIGVWPRIACFTAAVLLYHLAPLETIYWTANPFERGFTVSVLALLVLGASPSGDRLAIFPRKGALPAPSADYRWPVVLVQLFLCQVYFFAGYSKIFRAGPGWIDDENMRRWLLVFAQIDQVSTVRSLTLWIADRPLLCWMTAFFAVALDLGLISILVWPRLRGWLIGAVLAFHAGIAVLMGIAFLNIPQLLIFADWDRMFSRWAVRGAAEPDRAARAPVSSASTAT